jgi:simple sugar transport system ATP-binding protein
MFIFHLSITVSNINLTVREGEVFGLAGLEGSGQQLVLKACAGLTKADYGHIFLAGKEITGWSYQHLRQAGIGYVAAGRLEEGLVSGLSITEHLVLSQPASISWAGSRALTDNRIDQYKIVGRNSTMAENLSGGNQQRLLIALLWDSLKLVLLEHPTRGLDVRSADWIWEQLYQRRDTGTAILFMSADLDEIIERSDRIAVFSGGRMSRILEARQTTVEEIGHLIGGQA